MSKAVVFILGVVLSLSAHAESRQDSLGRLMKASGLMEMINRQKEDSKTASEKQLKQLLDQVFEKINPDQKTKDRISLAAKNYLQKLQSPWSTDEIIAVWSQYYGAGFTDEELKELADFHESPLGQKDREASQSAILLFTDHFRKLGEPIFKKANDGFLNELQLAISECKCRKQ